MRTPLPQQSSSSTREEESQWRAQERFAVARMEVLAGMVVSKRDMQKEAPKKYQEKVFLEFKDLEEQRAKEALELAQKKHMLIRWEGEGERARIFNDREDRER